MRNLLLATAISLLTQATIAKAETPRIQSMRLDKSQVHKIYLIPGLGSMITYPCPIQEIFVGRSDDLKTQPSTTDKKTVFINLKLNTSLPTNIIAKCSGQNSVFIFDVIPNSTNHQDYVQINGSYSRPANQLEVEETIREGIRTKVVNRIVIQSPVLLGSESEDKK